MLTLDEALEYALTRDGQFLVPPNIFKYDMKKIENLFKSVVRTYERICPFVKMETLYVTREGIHLNAFQVKSLGFIGNSNNELLPTMARPTNYRYWTFDADSQLLRSQVDAWYAVKYLQPYTQLRITQVHDIDDTVADIEYSDTLEAVPNIKSLIFSSGDYVCNYKMLDQDDPEIAIYEGSLGSCRLDTRSNEFSLLINEDVKSENPLKAFYTTKYKGFQELSMRDDFLLDMFSAELLAGLGSLKAMSKIENVPLNWNADEIMAYGRQLRADCLERRQGRTDFFSFLP